MVAIPAVALLEQQATQMLSSLKAAVRRSPQDFVFQQTEAISMGGSFAPGLQTQKAALLFKDQTAQVAYYNIS